MAAYESIALPDFVAGKPVDNVADGIRGWITSAPLTDLIRQFGGQPPDADTDDDTGTLLTWLDAFTHEHWDFRDKSGQVERDDVASGLFTPTVANQINASARALGLIEPRRARQRSYDHLLVLGGLAAACLQRTAYAAHLLSAGGPEGRTDSATPTPTATATGTGTGTASGQAATVEVGRVAALGSFRQLRTKETALLDGLAVTGCEYEVDAMDAGIRLAFGFAEPTRSEASEGSVTHRSWSVRTYQADGRPPVDVLAAPSTDPDTRRANTPDTYKFWAERVTLTPGQTVLVVTSPIYVPFQHCDAVRELGLRYHCQADTIGFDPGADLPVVPTPPGPDRYLQEIRSAILSMKRLFNVFTNL